MKKIHSWGDLAPFGIEFLTGEACGLSFRILCDVTAKGRNIVAKCLGIDNLTLNESWNRGSTANPHIGSIMLTHHMVTPLGVFALLEHGCREVWVYKDGSLRGIEAGDDPELLKAIEEMESKDILRRLSYQGTAKDRNVHQMSGRVT